MKSKILILVLLAIISITICEHAYGQSTKNLGTSIRAIVVKYKLGGNTYYTDGAQYHIGRQNDTAPVPLDSTTSEDTYRTEFYISLSSIPSNATITSCYLTCYAAGSSQYAFKVKQTTGQYTYQSLWNAISSASTLFSGLIYGSTHQCSSSTLTSAVQNALSSGTLYLAAQSQNESTNGSGTTVSITLNVTYTFPISITAKNNFQEVILKLGLTQQRKPKQALALSRR